MQALAKALGVESSAMLAMTAGHDANLLLPADLAGWLNAALDGAQGAVEVPPPDGSSGYSEKIKAS
jgi:hypothetical protein